METIRDGTNKSAVTVGCCSRLHNFCIDMRLELDDDVRRSEGELQIQPGARTFDSLLNRHGGRFDNLETKCRYRLCQTGARDCDPKDDSRHNGLEQRTTEAGLTRHRRPEGVI